MRIERVRVDGFGALEGVDLEWPDGRLVLVVDPNETGKTTFCEAIVAALYGLPRGRVGAIRIRDLRRPRGGAPMRVGLDLLAEGVRWAVDRDLEAGTLRVVNRDTGLDVTKDFMRGGGRDVLGERFTGLTEALFRTTAYVGQNVLDDDALDSNLTYELAKIADSGGGEASVVRALRLLQEVRAKMPDAASGPTVSVETEILRLTRKADERRAEVARLASVRVAAAEASARLATLVAERDRRKRAASLAEIAVVETERAGLVARLAVLAAERDEREKLEAEEKALERDAAVFTPQSLAVIDELRSERGTRPESLAAARRALEEERAVFEREARERLRRFGPPAGLSDEERARLVSILNAVVESATETASATEALEAQWDELRREGLAEDLTRIDAIQGSEREFLFGAEEQRKDFELQGVQCDRRAAETSGAAAIVAGERRERVKRGRGLTLTAAVLLPVAALLSLGKGVVPSWVSASAIAFAVGLGLVGAIAWLQGVRYRLTDEAELREEEAAARREAAAVRKKLSDLRVTLDRLARHSGFPDTQSLIKALRRARTAETKRRNLIEREARRDAALARRASLERDLQPFRDAVACSTGLPTAEDATRLCALLLDIDKAVRAAETRSGVLAREVERLDAEEESIAAVERDLREALERVGIPRRLPLPEALLMAESGRRRSQRRREILEVELPARKDPTVHGRDEKELEARAAALEAETSRRLAALGASRDELVVSETPEAARRAAEEARERLAQAEEARAAAERDLAARGREGGERSREAEEGFAEAAAALSRARLFRDAVDLARESLSSAASAAYGDFRQGLAEASRSILEAWSTPYEALEFGDDLSVSAIVGGGRVVTRAEIASSLSTGTREQLHLTARLAALRYLGMGTSGVPLLLDDPLVGADDERFVKVMRFLVEQVLLERPVLLVSCHGWRHQRLLEVLPEETRSRVATLSLRSA